MHSRNNLILILIYFIGDLLAVMLSWLFAIKLRFAWKVLPLLYGVPQDLGPYYHLVYWLGPVWLAVFALMGMYRTKRSFFLRDELPLLYRASVVALLALLALVFFSKFGPAQAYSRGVVFLFFILALFSQTTLRLFGREFLRYLHLRQINLRKALIVGTGELAKTLSASLRRELWTGFRLIGHVAYGENVLPKTETILGEMKDLVSIVEAEKIEHVFITLPFSAHTELEGMMNALSSMTVDISLIPDVFEFDILQNSTVHELGGLPIVAFSSTPLYGWNRFLKRAFDIFFSLIVIVGLSPVYLAIAIGVKLSSRGPVFYKQERMGLDGKTFLMLKFRSMPVDVEASSGPKWASKGEKRATKFGAFLRKTSLDELPQFFNALVGQMSVVGPRPERPVFIHDFKNKIPGYMLRHKTKAGITGWAQVNGWRGDTSLEKRIDFDLYYIKHWSFLFDLRIIVLTLWKGFAHPNAY